MSKYEGLPLNQKRNKFSSRMHCSSSTTLFKVLLCTQIATSFGFPPWFFGMPCWGMGPWWFWNSQPNMGSQSNVAPANNTSSNWPFGFGGTPFWSNFWGGRDPFSSASPTANAGSKVAAGSVNGGKCLGYKYSSTLLSIAI